MGIAQQPASLTVTVGQAASFTVTPSGTGPFTYQWSKGGAALPGATSATYSIAAAASGDAGSYTVTITSSAGTVTSTAATLTVNAATPAAVAPSITTQPSDATVTAGQPASFTIVATGTAPLSYQWNLGGTAIAGATSATYPITAAASTDAGSYTVTVTNSAGSVTSNAATLTVNAPAVLVVAPLITTPPASLTVTAGQPATFTVAASGTAPLTYQWNLGGTAISGATSATYSIAAAAAGDAGSYTVTVGNSAGSVTSGAATLTVNAAVVTAGIGTQPADVTVVQGQPATFTVVASGTAPFTYQWKKGGTAILGATSATYTLASTASGDSGSYTVTVTNSLGSVTSNPAVLTVNPPTVVITSNPQPASVVVPDGATFSVSATGSNLTYTWLKNGSSFGAPNASSYTVPATDLRNVADQYSVTITDGVTTVTSQAATLTVKAPIPVYAGDPTLNLPGHIYQVLPSWNLTPPADPVLGSFRVGYDSTTLNPSWSATCFFPVLGNFANTRPGTYPTDTRITGATPVQSGDYSGSGFSRGHQTGYADIAQRYGQPGGDSTMYMTNMCPQTQVLNGGVWEDLAGVLNGTSGQSFSNTYGRVWVYTGPIFANPLVTPIGPRNIPIPSAFYNVVLRETSPGHPVAIALIIPHTTTIGGATQSMTINDCWKYVTSIDRVQALTGITFFPNPTSPLPAGLTSNVDIRGWGSVLENGINKPNVHMIEPSWDSTFTLDLPLTTVKVASGTVGTPINFTAQATTSGTGAASTIASTTWTFGDNGTANVPSTTYTYSAPGDYTVTFTATDGAGVSNSISRVITVVGASPTAPSISAVANASTNDTTPVTVNFTVSDMATLAGNLTISATSSNGAVLGNTLPVTNNNGACSLVLTPISGGLGTSTVTLTVTNGAALTATQTFTFTVTATPAHSMDEGFGTGTKSSYGTGTVVCDMGSWTLNGALIATVTGSDRGTGTQCVRMGKYASNNLTMNWDFVYGAKTVTVNHALYGSDAPSAWKLQYSINGGSTWIDVPGGAVTTSIATLTNASFTVNLNVPAIRFQIIRTDTGLGRFDLDDFIVNGY